MSIKRLGIWGAEREEMAWIIHAAIANGLEVLLVDPVRENIEKMVQVTRSFIDEGIREKQIEPPILESLNETLKVSHELKALALCDIILDNGNSADSEKIFSELDDICPKSVLLVAASPQHSITKLARVTKREDRVLGLHPIPPLSVLKLVEIVRGVKTGQSALNTTREVLSQLKLQTVMAQDFPGYLVFRNLAPAINDAIFGLYEGLATAEEIDKAIRTATGQAYGPLALGDLIGLDVILNSLRGMHQELGNARFAPCPLLVKYVEAGYCGRKSGKGFFEYAQEKRKLAIVENN